MSTPLDPAPTLAGLKDFQRRTVEYAFHRLFLASPSAHRFLVADEVGLGKTLVARGVIAKAVQHLQTTKRRVNVVYVCSNADIATQNIGRLKVEGQDAFARATRLTLLPQELRNPEPGPGQSRVNFISFTPGTTFNMRSRSGTMEERRLMCQILADGRERRSVVGLQRLSRAAAGELGWQEYVAKPVDYDGALATAFRSRVASMPRLAGELEELAEYFYDRRHVPDEVMHGRALQLISDLRNCLARVCLKALSPDLVILDEFQRFRDLLNPDDPAAELAQTLFKQRGVRVLLLSATPYKLYARNDEPEDHYSDFLQTIRFLMDGDGARLAGLQRDLASMRASLLGSADDDGQAARRNIQSALLDVMCRTERVAATRDHDAMVREIVDKPTLRAEELDDLTFAEGIAHAVGAPDAFDYWKSSPYLMNFMGDYELKRRFVRELERDGGQRFTAPDFRVARSPRLLRKRAIQRLQELDPANGRLRTLMEHMTKHQMWRLLWIPPSLPYWSPAGAFADSASVTKTLVFSAWNVVPDALSALLSYEAERRMVGNRRDLRYGNIDRYAGRLTGTNVFAALCPSPALAKLIDPLAIARAAAADEPVDRASVLRATVAILDPLLDPLVAEAPTAGLPDLRWYWIAVARLTMQHCPSARNWASSTMWTSGTESDQEGIAPDIRRSIRAFVSMPDSPLGAVPHDLREVVAELALGGPGVCALRSLKRAAPELQWDDPGLLAAAWTIAMGFRALFNRPEVFLMLQHEDSDVQSYWQRVLSYCVDGNLASLLDEQVHLLVESLGVVTAPAGERASKVAREIHTALSIRTTTLRPDDIRRGTDGFRLAGQIGMRCRYAVRFGAQDEQDKSVSRKEAIRVAFNSPFRPFVLATTSVGQEGLDFHQWCHSVVHWNLPANAVDLEQREGRVHRYKGHAVRKNIASAWGRRALQNPSIRDVWPEMFSAAVEERQQGVNALVPYWIYEVENGAKVERRFLITPLSSEEARQRSLTRDLTMYRLVFGQPRQEDLMGYIGATTDQPDVAKLVKRWLINLEPPAEPDRTDEVDDRLDAHTPNVPSSADPTLGYSSGLDAGAASADA